MQSKEADLEFYATGREELFLSGKDLAELLRDTVAKGHFFRFKAKGFSMSPFIRDSDIITVSPLSNSKIGLGKIVAIVQPDTGRLIVHRVVGKNGNRYVIKGDNTWLSDCMISEESMLGYVTMVERNGKKSYIGLGPERILLALLNRFLFFPSLFFIRRFMRIGVGELK